MPVRKTILITGMPRSGTTPIGEVICAVKGCGELYEPMNPDVGDKAVQSRFEIPGVDHFSEEVAEDFLDRLKRRRLQIKIPDKATGRNAFVNRTRRTALQQRFLPSAKAIVWKDPYAFFMVPQIAKNRDWPIIITMRAPLSAVGSFQRMGWTPDIAKLHERARLAGLGPDISEHLTGNLSRGQASALLWHFLYSIVLDWKNQGLPILVVDTARNLSDPQAVAEELSELTGIDIPAQENKFDDNNNRNLPQKTHIKKRSTSSITDLWKSNLSDEDVEFCRTLNTELWERFEARQ